MAPGGAAIGGLILQGVEAAPGGARVLRGIDLEVPEGGRLAVVGPSGAGKTTLLRVIAGLEPSATGRILAGGEPLGGLPPHRRPIAMVFQDARLIPGLDAAENVAFALRAAGIGRRERRARADALLAEVGLGGLGRRGVRGLSGGEAQRVALARALCAAPRLLLLDEPMASADPDRRESLRRLILRLQAEHAVTTVLVTHDRDEAAEMGDEIALMIEGRIVQRDTPEGLFLRPATAAAARFMGARNLLAGRVTAGVLATAAGPVPAPGADGPARLVIRPEAIGLDAGGRLRMTVRSATFTGTGLRVELEAGEMRLEARCPADATATVGAEVGVTVPPGAVWRLPDEPSRAGDAGHAPALRP